MSYRLLTNQLYVGPQITEADIAQAADEGIKTIINVRPDGEKEGAMPAAEARGLAEARGISYHHMPVSPTNITDEDVAGFAELLTSVEGPVLTHCGTGMRAAVLWGLGNAKALGVEAVVSKAAGAGIDLSRVVPRLQQAAA